MTDSYAPEFFFFLWILFYQFRSLRFDMAHPNIKKITQKFSPETIDWPPSRQHLPHVPAWQEPTHLIKKPKSNNYRTPKKEKIKEEEEEDGANAHTHTHHKRTNWTGILSQQNILYKHNFVLSWRRIRPMWRRPVL